MKFLIQRVKKAVLSIDGSEYSHIGRGFLILIGIGQNDTRDIADKYVKKALGLRIFEDQNGKTNLSLAEVCGEVMAVSQFTLYANCRKGNRPSFIEAGKPDMANDLYDYIVGQMREQLGSVQTGVFGEEMEIELVNDGPFTILLDEQIL